MINMNLNSLKCIDNNIDLDKYIEYREYVNNTKVPTKKDNQEKREYDNSILTKLGLSSSDL